MKTWTEKVVEYAGELDVAALEVIAELDEIDGIVYGSKEYRLLIREVAELHKVGRKDLMMRVRDYL